MKGYLKYIGSGIAVFAIALQSIGDSVNALSTNSSMVEQQTIEYQSLDGTGNNISNPLWGSVGQQFIRMSFADYADGVSSPSGENRPSARALSNELSAGPEDGILNDRDMTAFVYAWGQFLDHDITLTDPATPAEAFHITVPTGDEWFDPSGTGTMIIPLARSNYDPSTGSSTNSPRQQVNSITAFIDGSQIYGVDEERGAALREFRGGRMKVGGNELLPLNSSGFENANDAHIIPDDQLFLAGDVRANENPELLSLHILFVREHNRIADEAAQQHPDWTDEELYQYARRIVIAELQKITYEEFLPSLLGNGVIPRYRGYDADVDPGIATEFSTAAYRFGHSMLGDDIEFLNNDGEETREAVDLRNSFFNPHILNETDIDPVLKYLASDNAQEIDTMTVDDLRNFLFGEPGQGGFDLAALNIQRGRDHGLPDYNSVREAYGLRRVNSFDEITSNRSIQSSLRSMYGSVDNIDLWVGGLAEDHLPNSSLGITFTTILVDQFKRLRDGDRFWYESVLSREDLREVRNTTLADIIRRNTSLTKLQEDVFFFNDSTIIVDSSSDEPTSPAENEPTQQLTRPQQPANGCTLRVGSFCIFPRNNRPPRPGGPPPRR